MAICRPQFKINIYICIICHNSCLPYYCWGNKHCFLYTPCAKPSLCTLILLFRWFFIVYILTFMFHFSSFLYIVWGIEDFFFPWTLGVGDGQRGLACCGSWGRKELDTTEWLNWTELNGWRSDCSTMIVEVTILTPLNHLYTSFLKSIHVNSHFHL